MNKIDKLINELCPDGVEWKELGEVCEIIRGKSLSKSDIGLGDVPFILYGELYTTYGNYIEKIVSFTAKEKVTESPKIEYGSLLLPISSTTKEAQIGKVSAFMMIKDVYLGSDALMLKHKEVPGYLVHLLNSNWFEKFKMKCVFGTTIHHLNPNKFAKLLIPVPPLPIQQEIVNILDKFTALEAELQAELDARRKQYEYYREKLLTFSEIETSRGGVSSTLSASYVEWKTLGEVCLFRNGKGHEKDIVEDGDYIVVNSKFVSTEGKVVKYSDKQISPLYIDDILMVMSDLPNGKALAKTYIVSKNNKYTLNQRIGALTAKYKERTNPKFLYYILNRNKQLLRYDNGADQTNLRKDDILTISIPIPSLSEQNRIVGILDKFEELVNQSLPAEIEARRKQYEYYREKLLTFGTAGFPTR